MSVGYRTNTPFLHTILKIALPISIQSVLFSLFNILDQLMVGQLGSTSVVAVSLASKHFSILNFTLVGLTGGLAIFTAQLVGKQELKKIAKIQGMVLASGIILILIFTFVSLFVPAWSMSLFSADKNVIIQGSIYHRSISFGYLPFFITMVYTTILRNAKFVKLPMYIGIGAVIFNAFLNYIFIFGNFGFPRLGILGSGLATTLSQYLECIILLYIVFKKKMDGSYNIKKLFKFLKFDKDIKSFWIITIPLLIEQVSFILADSASNSIYGFMGTKQTIAITVMIPIQGLIINFFTGFSAASSVIIGNYLGENKKDDAYKVSSIILILGLVLPLLIGGIYLLINTWYLGGYHLSPYSYNLTSKLMFIMIFFLPIKILNMVIVQGILPAGGETKFILYQSLLGSWILAIPMGLIAAFILHLSIDMVFIAVSFEEIVRLIIGLVKIRSKNWLNKIV